MRAKIQRLYSGTFRCADCGCEWHFEHVEALRCPECGGTDLAQLDTSETESEEER